jgi:sugar phosphate isomerase/epimerase
MTQMTTRVEPILSFSTLACPEWSPTRVVAQAAAIGYDGIEWRGGHEGHVPPDMAPAELRAISHAMDDHGVKALALTAYGSLVAHEPRERARESASLRRSIDLAFALSARFVRVFVGLPTDSVRGAALRDRAVGSLDAVADHAAVAGVTIALELHDLHARAADMLPILERSGVAVVWDIGNAWQAGEHPDDGLAALGRRIGYVQLKDGRGRGTDWRLCDLGDGDVPIGRALRGLAARGPLPPLSVEWERAWHHRLAPAEVALPAALAYVRSRLAEIPSHPADSEE